MLESEFDTLDQKLTSANGKIIHQIWFNFANPDTVSELPDKFKDYRESWLVAHPNWMHVLWNDKMGDLLVYKHYRLFWETYRNYPHPIQRVDTIRACILHRYGGVYADMDTKCFRSLDSLIEQMTKPVGIPKFPDIYGVSNYIMYSRPGVNFWLRYIEGCIQYGTWKNMIPYTYNVYNSGGPARLYKTMKKCPGEYEIFNAELFPTNTFYSSYGSDSAAYAVHIATAEWRQGLTAWAESLSGVFILLIVLVIVTAIIFVRRKNKLNEYHNVFM